MRPQIRAIPVGFVLAGLGSLMLPSLVLADHCGAGATITPPSGSAGTTFVFETNLGGDADLRVLRDGREIEASHIDTEGPIRYEIDTGLDDVGVWAVEAVATGQGACDASASFTVTGMPSTSTVPDDPGSDGVPTWLPLSIALGAFALALRRGNRPDPR